MAKIVDKLAAMATGWGGLKSAVEKGDASKVRRILVDHAVSVDLVEILLMVFGEAASLQEIVNAGESAENPRQLETELEVTHGYNPASLAEVAEKARAIEDTGKRLAAAKLAVADAEYARTRLAGLAKAFPLLVEEPTGSYGQPEIPVEIHHAKNRLGLEKSLFGWKENYKHQPIEPKKRFRLVAK